MTPAIQPTARTWMLRFKNGRTTIILHVDPTQKLDSIRAELLKAVQQTNPSGQLNGQSIPDSGDDLILARAIDVNDHNQGWEPLEKEDGEDEGEDKKGKGKAAVGKGKGKKAWDHTPSGCGLNDREVVAFRFKSQEEDWTVVEPSYEETYAEDAMAEG